MQKTIRAARLALGAFALAGLSAPASAAYVFTNDSGGDGSLAGTYPAFEITGSNNGVGDNTSFYLQTFDTAQIVTFTWQYGSLDVSGTVYDQAGFIHNGVETQLSVNADPYTLSNGSVSEIVAKNDTFGFYVHSDDSVGGAAYFAVNEVLILPPPPPAIPEPQTPALMLAGLATLFAAARRKPTRRE